MEMIENLFKENVSIDRFTSNGPIFTSFFRVMNDYTVDFLMDRD